MQREDEIVLGSQEQRRARVLTRVLGGVWTCAEGAQALGLSERQVRRLLRTYEAQGPGALVHGNRGRPPANQLDEALQQRVLALVRTTYAGCNDVHLAELLAERDKITVSRATLQRWRRRAQAAGEVGAGSPRSRRRPTHRTRRERATREGWLVQADGSPHRWLGPDGPELTLIAGIDDATGTLPWALFREQEDAAGYMTWLRRVVETKGVPIALYVDRHGIFQRRKHVPWTLEEELAGGPLPTQMGRVLEELGIRLIHALSPQAKGRVERLFGTLQDRLCIELRLAGATTLADADRVVAAYLPRFNARFAVPPTGTSAGTAYRPLAEVVPPGMSRAAFLDQICCFKYLRTVGLDNTVQFAGRRLQVAPGRSRRSYAKARVEVHERLDGSLAVFHQGHVLTTTLAPAEAPLLRARDLPRPPPAPAVPNVPLISPPPANTSFLSSPSPSPSPSPTMAPQPHPWRRDGFFVSRPRSRRYPPDEPPGQNR